MLTACAPLHASDGGDGSRLHPPLRARAGLCGHTTAVMGYVCPQGAAGAPRWPRPCQIPAPHRRSCPSGRQLSGPEAPAWPRRASLEHGCLRALMLARLAAGRHRYRASPACVPGSRRAASPGQLDADRGSCQTSFFPAAPIY